MRRHRDNVAKQAAGAGQLSATHAADLSAANPDAGIGSSPAALASGAAAESATRTTSDQNPSRGQQQPRDEEHDRLLGVLALELTDERRVQNNNLRAIQEQIEVLEEARSVYGSYPTGKATGLIRLFVAVLERNLDALDDLRRHLDHIRTRTPTLVG